MAEFYFDESLASEQDVHLWPLGEELVYKGTPNEYVRALPHYAKVPKGKREQIKWRNEIMQACATSPSSQKRIKKMCAEDVLFFLNSMCVVYEPRPIAGGQTLLPFNTWPHQDDVIAAIDHFLGIRDIGVNKSRGEGCSWIVLMIFLHRWLFERPEQSGQYGLVSMNEDLVYSATNKDSLFWKLDWELEHLPDWLVPKSYDRNKGSNTLHNPDNGTTFKGFACTQNVATGGRYTAFLMDELGKWKRPHDSIAMTSTQHVSHSRIIVSTPFGNEGAYFDAIHIPSSLLKLTMHWTHNPTRKRGLYQWDVKNERVRKLDADYKFAKDYPFEKDGKIRSPWYDAECRKPSATAKSIAQDLDLNFEQSVSLFFDSLTMNIAQESVKAPLFKGRFLYDGYGGPAEFLTDQKGNVRLWAQLMDGRIPPSRYVLGVDISEGTGTDYSSNSVIVGIDMATGEQVLEWADNSTKPEDCACLTVAIARWLQGESGNSPYLVWEAAGPGGRYGREIDALGYSNYYNHIPSKSSRKLKGAIPKSGYSNHNKADALTVLQVAVKIGRIVLFSDELVRELGEYRYTVNGKVDHVRAILSEEDSSKGALHGDRAMAAAMAAVGMNDFNSLRRQQLKPKPDNRPKSRLAGVIRELAAARWVDETVFD